MRSLPDEQSALVRSEGIPNPAAWSASSWLSVQSTVAWADVACRHRSSTCWSIVLPPMSATNLRGRRLESSRAGMARITVKSLFMGLLQSGWERRDNQGLLGETTPVMGVIGWFLACSHLVFNGVRLSGLFPCCCRDLRA